MQPTYAQISSGTITETEKQFGTTMSQGLSETQVDERIKKEGRNTLSHGKETVWNLLARQFNSVFVWLLLAAAGLSFFLGERLDGFMILFFVLIDVTLSFFQEYKSQHILESLKKYFVSRATVVRSGVQKQVLSTELVCGDVVILEPGDVIPADLRLFETIDFTVDESLLTGESRSVEKTSSTCLQPPTSLFEATNIGFSATHVLSGMAKGIVIAVGSKTEAGRTAKLATDTKHVSSFEETMNRFSVFMLQIVVGTLVVLFVLHYLIKGPTVQIGELMIFFVALAVSVVPEALPVVITFALSSGAKNLAKKQVVVKRLTAIEDLGDMDILCTDKTGTITEGVMTVGSVQNYAGDAFSIARLGIAGSNSNTNTFDEAMLKASNPVDVIDPSLVIVEHVGFDPKLRFDATLLKGVSYHVVMRGAPEAIALQCEMSEVDQRKMIAWIEQEGRLGRRVLGVAQGLFDSAPDHWEISKKMYFVGMISFEDPLKPSSVQALEKAKALGIQIKIITGDRPEVAGAIASQLHLIEDPNDVITGEDLFALSHEEQLVAVTRSRVFARVTPEAKLDILKLLKTQFRVGFLGEGINDAPALKEAHIGIVVQNASDVARESADIVLLEKSLLVILDGVEHGRKVSANTVKYIKTTLASNFGNFYSVAIASLFIPYLPMLSIQILLVNLLSDFPMIAIAGDTVDSDELSKPKGLNLHEMGFLTTFFGVVSSVFDFLLFATFVPLGPAMLQTAWFIESILTELVAIFSLRTKKWFFLAQAPARVLTGLVISAIMVTVALPFIPFTQKMFSFGMLSLRHLFTIGAIVLAYFIATELAKHLYYRLFERSQMESVSK